MWKFVVFKLKCLKYIIIQMYHRAEYFHLVQTYVSEFIFWKFREQNKLWILKHWGFWTSGSWIRDASYYLVLAAEISREKPVLFQTNLRYVHSNNWNIIFFHSHFKADGFIKHLPVFPLFFITTPKSVWPFKLHFPLL